MKIQISLFFGLILLLHLSCKSSEEVVTQKPSDDVIATIADQQITLDDLKANFNRNRNTEEIDSSEIQKFYPSYINYRLKLYEGYQQGYHKDSTILAEFNEYASEIADRFWIEDKIKNDRIETFKTRFEKELKAFHILKELPENVLPADTVEIYNTLVSVRDSLLNGASPDEMNERHSSKREDRSMGGQLSWFTAGSTIEPFEDTVYSLQPGEISLPVRSQFGYHIILLQEIRPRTPQRLVKHIFVRKTEDGSGQQKINLAYEALEANSSWNDVLQNYTEDSSTRNRDGLLGWVGYGGRFPVELIESAVQTHPDSAYSEPYEVSYGYHIMKVDSIQAFTSEEQKEEFVVNRLEELGRLNPDQEDMFDRIAEESDLKIDRDNFSEILRAGRDSTEHLNSQSDLELLHFNNETYTASDFQYWLDNISSVDEVMQSGNITESYRNYIIRQNLIDYTRNQFPEFASQVDPFLEGLIVFKVNEENIWNREAVDRSELKDFYESNRNEYKKGKTFIYTEISAPSDSTMQIVNQELINGVKSSELAEQFDEITIYEDSTSYSQSPLYSRLALLEPGEFSDTTRVNNRVFIYILNDIKDERVLSFEEAFDQVFTNYQPIREENYIQALKERYKLQLYPENLH